MEFGLVHIPPPLSAGSRLAPSTTPQGNLRPPRLLSGPRLAWHDGQEWQVQQKRSKCTGQLQGSVPWQGAQASSQLVPSHHQYLSTLRDLSQLWTHYLRKQAETKVEKGAALLIF